MNIVAKTHLRPHHCAVFPQLGSTQRDGYFDTGTDLQGPGVFLHRVYVSVVAVREMARKLGWISDVEADALRSEIRELQGQVSEALERADAAEAVVDSIDVIESAAFRARRKPGKQKAVA